MPDRRDSNPLPPTRTVQVLCFRPLRSGQLLGFCDVSFPVGLTLFDLPIFRGARGLWVQLPTRPQLDSSGQLRRDHRGKIAYAAVAKWNDKALTDRFSKFIVAQLERDYAHELADRAA
jgi:DNA-binding cell septation regulator SpoVG